MVVFCVVWVVVVLCCGGVLWLCVVGGVGVVCVHVVLCVVWVVSVCACGVVVCGVSR